MNAAAKQRTQALDVDFEVESPLWDALPEAETTVRTALAAASELKPSSGEMSVVLTDDASIRALNREWRKIDKPTNVLSFPAGTPAIPGVPALLGDVVVAYETMAREATEEGKQPLHHLAHLVVHGYLHLLGYDHEIDSEADAMEGLERQILARLHIADPYGAREPGNV